MKRGPMRLIGSKSAYALFLALALLLNSSPPVPLHAVGQREFMFGFDGTTTEALERSGLKWYSADGVELDPLAIFGRAGLAWFRMGITVNKTGSMGLEQGLELARWARDTAYKLDLVFYLSPALADLGKQPVSTEWKSLTLEDEALALRSYMRTTVSLFLQDGLSDHVYEIGNEIDYGIAGVFGAAYLLQGDSSDVIESVAEEVWRNEAHLLRGAIQGVREADADATIVLHIAHWWNSDFAGAFFDFMNQNGVQYDVMALSFYPSSGIVSLQDTIQNPNQGNGTRSQELLSNTIEELASTIQKPIIIAEYAYPSSPDIRGPFSWFDKEVSNYSLTPQGQAKWISDQLSWAYETKEILGAFYYQPEFYGPKVADIWQPFSLFDESGRPKPALRSFEDFALKSPELAERMPSRHLILDAWRTISDAQRTGRTVNLDQAIEKLNEAIALYMDSKYDEVVAPATEAKRLSEAASLQRQAVIWIGFPEILLAVSIGISLVIFRRARKPRRGKQN